MTRFPRIGRTLAAALLATAAGLPQALAAGTPATNGAVTTAIGSYLAGRFAQNQDDWPSAARYMEQALAADPGDLALMRRTFLLKLGEGKVDEAVALARKLMAQETSGPFAVTTVIADDLKAGRTEDARALARTMPRDGMARYVTPLVESWLLAADRQTGAMTLAAPGAEVHQPLDVHRGFATQVAFDDELGDGVTDFLLIAVRQVLDLLVVGNAAGFADLARARTTDAEDRRQADFGVLVRRNVDTSNTCHGLLVL